jgi:hypothetical protein
MIIRSILTGSSAYYFIFIYKQHYSCITILNEHPDKANLRMEGKNYVNTRKGLQEGVASERIEYKVIF